MTDVSGDDHGSAPVEFVLVGVLLTVLTLGVLQLGVALYVRNVIHDAAVDGAFFAALADTSVDEAEAHTRELITTAVGAEFAQSIEAHETGGTNSWVSVTVRAPLPVIGLFGVGEALEVSAHAPVETPR